MSRTVAFGTTLTMALSNPKAILGFGMPIIWFNSDKFGLFPIVGTLLSLYFAVGFAMVAYYYLGKIIGTTSMLLTVRKISSALLCFMGLYIFIRIVVDNPLSISVLN